MGFISRLCGLGGKKAIHDPSRNVSNTPPPRRITSSVTEVQSEKQYAAKPVLLPRQPSQRQETQHIAALESSTPEPLTPLQKPAHSTAPAETTDSVQGSLTPAQRSSLNGSSIQGWSYPTPPQLQVRVPAPAANPAQVELPDVEYSPASIQSNRPIQLQRPPTPPQTQVAEQAPASSQLPDSMSTSVLLQELTAIQSQLVVQPPAPIQQPQVPAQSQFSFQWPPLAAQLPHAVAQSTIPFQSPSNSAHRPSAAANSMFSSQRSSVPVQEPSVLVQPLVSFNTSFTSTQPLLSFNTLPISLQGSPNTAYSPPTSSSRPKEPQHAAQLPVSYNRFPAFIEGPPVAAQPSSALQQFHNPTQGFSNSSQWPAVSVQPVLPIPSSSPIPSSVLTQSSFSAQSCLPSMEIPPGQMDMSLWHRDWEYWIYKESTTLPDRQKEFDQRRSYPFVQITRTKACNFYNIESAEMDAALPQRNFNYGDRLASAFEHKAVRRLAYLRIAYLKGWHQRISGEEQLYQKGRELFNQYHDERVDEYRTKGITFTPISIYYRNNNEYKDHRYRPIVTGFDSREHDKYD